MSKQKFSLLSTNVFPVTIFPQVKFGKITGMQRFAECMKEKLAGRFSARLLLIALCFLLTSQITYLTAQVVSVSPAQNALNVSPDTTIQVTFAVPMDTTTFNDTNSILVHGKISGRYRGTFAYGGGNTVVIFTANSLYMQGDFITVTLTNKIKAGTGNTISPVTFQFTISTNVSAGRFSQKVDYTIGEDPRSIFVSDLDGDGDGELLVTSVQLWDDSSGNRIISIFKNNGDGTFQPKADYATGAIPNSIFVSDLDGDGNGDILVTNYDYHTVSILKNNGDGTFQPKVDYATGTYPYSVFVFDLDGDGDQDFAVVHQSNSGVSIFKNNGDGTFQPKVDYATAGYSNCVFISDLDGDGDGDLAVGNNSSYTVSILMNNGDGTFQAQIEYPAGYECRSIFVSDIDGDGDGDLAVANSGSNSVSILKNNGDGTFQPKVDYETSTTPQSVCVSDIEGDGEIDLIVVNTGSNTVSVYRNNGDGTFQSRVDYPTGMYPNALFVSDLDGDGDVELVVANNVSQTISIFKNIVNDVAVQTNTPSTGFVSSNPMTPISASVKNFSPTVKTFDVLAQIDTVTGTFNIPLFSNTQTVSSLDSNQIQNVSFGNWIATSSGQYKLRVTTLLTEDEDRLNDTLVTTFTVIVPVNPIVVIYENESQGGSAVKTALTNKGYLFDEFQNNGDIPFSLRGWQKVVWVAGQDAGISSANSDSLISFLNSGGRLLLLGNKIASNQASDDSANPTAILVRQKLGINWVSNFTAGSTT
ncbi:MAG: VCBS repeat-containing protein, partial [Ignavibacteriae bacterium]|nr:VCBS repeat-containing protein [Ignavibacteriota bacterium]